MASQTDVQIGWQDYLAIASRRRTFFLVPVVASLIIGLIYSVVAPRVYRATAVILVKSEKLINPLIQGLAVPTPVSDRLQTLREEILSWSNLNRLIREHDLDARLPKQNPVAFEQLVQRLRKDVRVRMKGESLIEVAYDGGNPAKVQEVVNALTDIVIARNRSIQEEEANTAISFIEAELGVYRAKLEGSEKKLREFKELYMTQMPVATALNSHLRDLEVQLSNLLVDNTQDHPRVVEVKRRIEEVRKQRDEEIRRLVEKGVIAAKDPAAMQELLDEMSAAKANAAKSQAVNQAVEAVVAGLESPEVQQPGPQVAVTGGTVQISSDAAATLTLAPRQQQELASLTRDYSVNESIYRGLLEKLERAKITGRLGEDDEGGKFIVMERARYPVRPVRPKVAQVLFIALAIGIMLGIGAVAAAEYLDQSVQTSEEAAELLGVPVLGAISRIVTEADLEERTRRRQSWTSPNKWSVRLKTYVLQPVWARIDKTLVRWGL